MRPRRKNPHTSLPQMLSQSKEDSGDDTEEYKNVISKDDARNIASISEEIDSENKSVGEVDAIDRTHLYPLLLIWCPSLNGRGTSVCRKYTIMG